MRICNYQMDWLERWYIEELTLYNFLPSGSVVMLFYFNYEFFSAPKSIDGYDKLPGKSISYAGQCGQYSIFLHAGEIWILKSYESN